MAKKLDVWELRELLKKACAEAGGQKAWATRNSVSGAYVNDVLQGRREPGESITTALGYRRKVEYVQDAWDDKPKGSSK